ncbi:MAG TPA: 30S ribosomal protein S16 [Actinomycetota bacterium]|nr:30S ribosomal protein S16 [Actinomycetota bacterium]
MVKIRLMRVGKKKQPSFRVVVADSRSPRDGRIIEAIGHYNPRVEPSTVEIDNERALYWLQRGAQPSDSVRHLLRVSGAWTEFTGEASGKTAAAPRPQSAGGDAARKKATPAASVTVAEDQGTEEVADLPEADDQAAAAPDAEPGETTE